MVLRTSGQCSVFFSSFFAFEKAMQGMSIYLEASTLTQTIGRAKIHFNHLSTLSGIVS